MSTPGITSLIPEQAFASLPAGLAKDLLDAFAEIVTNYAQERWEPAELNGGKLCEAAYSVCKGLCDGGSFPSRAEKPQNMLKACRDLEQAYPQAHRSPRILVPRMIIPLYDVRNNRGVGHAGGEVDPNHMDAVCVLQMAKWIVAELVRVLHQLPVAEAAALVDALVERETPLVWKVGGVRRVLDTTLSMKAKALLLLHGCSGPVAEADLVAWVEHSNPSVFRRDVLRKAHKSRLVEYDASSKTVVISPNGIKYVEEEIIAPHLGALADGPGPVPICGLDLDDAPSASPMRPGDQLRRADQHVRPPQVRVASAAVMYAGAQCAGVGTHQLPGPLAFAQPTQPRRVVLGAEQLR